MKRGLIGLYPPWLDRDAIMIILARGIRTFAQSFAAVLLALYLIELGFNLFQIGVFLSVGVVGVAFFAFLVGLVSGRVGRKPLLIFFSVTSAAAGFALVFIENYIVLLAIAFLGQGNRVLIAPRFGTVALWGLTSPGSLSIFTCYSQNSWESIGISTIR